MRIESIEQAEPFPTARVVEADEEVRGSLELGGLIHNLRAQFQHIPEHGDAAGVLKETGAGVMLEEIHHKKIQATLLTLYQEWKKGETNFKSPADTKYSRKEITRRLTELLQ